MNKFGIITSLLLLSGCSTGYIQEGLETVDALIQTEEQLLNGEPSNPNGQLKSIIKTVPVKVTKPKSLHLHNKKILTH